jgi:hypothetical protein
MEDRLNPALYLELLDATHEPAVYRSGRADEILSKPGAEAVTIWQNERPGRDEYPRSIEEFGSLAVYETGEAFERPTETAGVRGLDFVRCPRPPQGTLDARPTNGLLLVLVTPTSPDAAGALRDWADFNHIHHIAGAGIEGFGTITAYENRTEASPRYLHLYELHSDAPEATFQTMAPLTIERRLGEPGSDRYRSWFSHEALVIDYINTFRRIEIARS